MLSVLRREGQGSTPPGETPKATKHGLRSLAITGFVAVAVLAAGLVAYRFVPNLRPKADDAPLVLPGVPRAPAPSPPPASTGHDALDPDRLTPFSGRDFGMRSRFSSAIMVSGAFEPLRGDIFTNEEAAYALDGIEAPPASAICLGQDKRLWACGLQARAALQGFIKGKALSCILQSGRPIRKPRDPGNARWNCQIEGRDLALLLVEGGWAKANSRTDRAFILAEDTARQAQRGLWDGGWNIVRVPE